MLNPLSQFINAMPLNLRPSVTPGSSTDNQAAQDQDSVTLSSTEISAKLNAVENATEAAISALEPHAESAAPTNVPEAPAAPEGPSAGNVYSDDSTQSFNGSGQHGEIAHDDSMLLDNGTIEFSFKAGDLNGKQGLLSKDSSGFDDGGHIDFSLNGDRLELRLQSTNKSYTLKSDKIKAGEEVDVALTFGDDGMKLFINGELEDSNSYTGGLGTSSGGSGNENPWAVGASASGSGNNSNSGLRNYFNGSVSGINIHDNALSTQDLASRQEQRVAVRDHEQAQIAQQTQAAQADYAANRVRGNVLSLDAMQFDGNDDYVNVNHDSSMMLDNGTLEIAFTADDTSGRQGLFTKDSSGYDDGGHLSVFQNGDEIMVRLQSNSTSYELSGGTITAGQEAQVAVSFGDAGMELYVDGALVDSNSYTGGLGTSSGGSGNENPIALGANNWSSGNNTNDKLKDYFSGSIAEVNLFDSQLSSNQIADRVSERANAGLGPAQVASGEATYSGQTGNILSLGANSFDGKDDYVEVAHASNMMLDNGTIELEFNAADTNGNQGLFSKDSTNFDDGGHVTIMMVGDQIEARIQSDNASYTLKGGTIKAGQESHVAFSFGEEGISLMVNGEEVDSSGYTGGLGTSSGGSGNENPIAIGASGRRSGDNSNSGLRDFFKGSITKVNVFDTQMNEAEAARRADGNYDPVEVATPEEPVAEQPSSGGSSSSAGSSINEVLGQLQRIDERIEAGGDPADTAAETWRRLNNVIGHIEGLDENDPGKAVLSQQLDSLKAQRSELSAFAPEKSESSAEYRNSYGLSNSVEDQAKLRIFLKRRANARMSKDLQSQGEATIKRIQDLAGPKKSVSDLGMIKLDKNQFGMGGPIGANFSKAVATFSDRVSTELDEKAMRDPDAVDELVAAMSSEPETSSAAHSAKRLQSARDKIYEELTMDKMDKVVNQQIEADADRAKAMISRVGENADSIEELLSNAGMSMNTMTESNAAMQLSQETAEKFNAMKARISSDLDALRDLQSELTMQSALGAVLEPLADFANEKIAAGNERMSGLSDSAAAMLDSAPPSVPPANVIDVAHHFSGNFDKDTEHSVEDVLAAHSDLNLNAVEHDVLVEVLETQIHGNMSSEDLTETVETAVSNIVGWKLSNEDEAALASSLSNTLSQQVAQYATEHQYTEKHGKLDVSARETADDVIRDQFSEISTHDRHHIRDDLQREFRAEPSSYDRASIENTVRDVVDAEIGQSFDHDYVDAVVKTLSDSLESLIANEELS